MVNRGSHLFPTRPQTAHVSNEPIKGIYVRMRTRHRRSLTRADVLFLGVAWSARSRWVRHDWRSSNGTRTTCPCRWCCASRDGTRRTDRCKRMHWTKGSEWTRELDVSRTGLVCQVRQHLHMNSKRLFLKFLLIVFFLCVYLRPAWKTFELLTILKQFHIT